MKPLLDRVVVKKVEPEVKTTGGIHIPDSAQEAPQKATVIAVGPGEETIEGKLIPVGVDPGETVLFAKYAGTEFKIQGVEYTCLNRRDILMVLEEDELLSTIEDVREEPVNTYKNCFDCGATVATARDTPDDQVRCLDCKKRLQRLGESNVQPERSESCA